MVASVFRCHHPRKLFIINKINVDKLPVEVLVVMLLN